MKTLKNAISPLWDFREFEVEKQIAEERGLHYWKPQGKLQIPDLPWKKPLKLK